VDDVVFGVEEEESAYKFYLESKEILRNESFNLRKFTTNCPSLQDKISKAEDPDNLSQSEGVLDETFAKTTLGDHHHLRLMSKNLLSVCWDT
jgi:hypothetical protein